ncbi:EAL domain-containing protein [Sphingomonas sp.]|uniref:EAL domain-containing protein n=1 Tax=Sphingomonas sp. TaxID=28214 RepID=UPI0026009AB2|nr:EAL domain-containing protein [Sphingomonas sp.]
MARLGFWQGKRGVPANHEHGFIDATSPVADEQNGSRLASAARAERVMLLENYEESGQGWFWATDCDGNLTYLTEGVASLLGEQPGCGIGVAFTDLFLHAATSAEAPRSLPFILTKRSKLEKLTLRGIVASEERWWSVSGRPHFDAAGQFTGYRGSGVNITEQRRTSEHASMLAMYDSLTGLPNRLRMSETLEANLIALEHQKRSCAIMLIDLDRFKQVNDTLGHPAGDDLLKQVADRLLRIVADREHVFRLGGDEFQIIVRNCDDREALGDLANRIIASLSQPYSVKGSRCIIGASVGVAVSPVDGRTSEELIRNADLALYAAKDGGRGRFRFFSQELLQTAEEKRVLEEDLRDALGNDEIKLFYQPIVNASTNRITGVEALVRWHHPTRGPISPALFIPIAEEADLIERLGEWVLRKACEDAAAWPGGLRVSVNVSPIQFTNNALPGIVLSALATSGLSADRLELEITEGVFLSESTETDTMFATLKGIGVRLALDDFGTGYSSLSYLRTAPFDKIKIDQSFVRAATLPKSRNRAIIAAIVALAEALGMETTAEGIESHDQLELVRKLRVTNVQGFIYSKAVSFDEMTERLSNGEWDLAPIGPAKQRSDRLSMYRTVGAIYGNHFRPVLIRNLSESGALIEGLMDVPVGGLLLLDFGEGQLAFARVRRTRTGKYGVQFEQQMVSDGEGGLCTSHRVSPYLLNQLGLPSPNSAGRTPVPELGEKSALAALRNKLGLDRIQVDFEHDTVPDEEVNAQSGSHAIGRSGGPTMRSLSLRYLDHLANDGQRREIDARYLNDDILPRFGHLSLDAIAPTQITEWLGAKVRENGYSPAKVSRLQGIMGQMYVLAMQWGLPADNVALQSISLFNRNSRERSLTIDEVARLNTATQASPNPQLKNIVSLLMMTGTRQRELFEACWDQIDLEKRAWRIPAAVAANTRTVTLSAAAVGLLIDLPRYEECSYLIVNPTTRKPFRSLHASWDSARKKAGLADVEIDDLRHSAPHEAGADSIPIDPIKAAFGRRG